MLVLATGQWFVVHGQWFCALDMPKSPLNCYLRVRRVRWHLWSMPLPWHLLEGHEGRQREGSSVIKNTFNVRKITGPVPVAAAISIRAADLAINSACLTHNSITRCQIAASQRQQQRLICSTLHAPRCPPRAIIRFLAVQTISIYRRCSRGDGAYREGERQREPSWIESPDPTTMMVAPQLWRLGTGAAPSLWSLLALCGSCGFDCNCIALHIFIMPQGRVIVADLYAMLDNFYAKIINCRFVLLTLLAQRAKQTQPKAADASQPSQTVRQSESRRVDRAL